MKEFLFFSKKQNLNINFSIVKSLSVLTPCIKNKGQLFFYFSNNYINQLITLLNVKDENNDDYIVYYANFLKSISQKIDSNYIPLLLDIDHNSFPLLDNALLLTNDKDEMIKNTGRNIMMAIIKIKYPLIMEYICNPSTLSFFVLLVENVKKLIINLIQSLSKENFNKDEVIDLNEQIQNEILFFQDIFSINNKKLNYILTNCIFSILIMPFLFKNIITGDQYEISILIIWELLNFIKLEEFINLLISLLFDDFLYYRVYEYIESNKENLENEFEQFFFHKIKECTNFEDYLISKFSEEFLNSFPRNDEIDKFEEGKKIREKVQNNIKGKGVNEYILNEINNFYQERQLSLNKMKKYHSFLSKMTGIRVGLDYKSNQKCFLHVMEKTFIKYKNVNKMTKNKIKEAFIQKLKENTISDNENNDMSIMYNSFILHHLLTKKKETNKEVLKGLFLIKKDSNINEVEFYDINAIDDYYVENKEQEIPKIKDNSKTNINLNFSNYLNYINEVPSISKGLSIFSNNNYFSNCQYYKDKDPLLTTDIANIILQLLQKNDFPLSKITLKCLFDILLKIHIQNKIAYSIFLSKAYTNTLTQIIDELTNINNSGLFYSNCYEIFKKEFEQYQQNFDELIQLTLKDLFISKMKFDTKETDDVTISEFLKPKNEMEYFSNLLTKFLLVSDVINFYEKKPKYLHSHFPITLDTKVYLIGSPFEFLNGTFNLYKVKYKNTKIDKAFEVGLVFAYNDNLFFLNFDNKKQTYHIRQKFNFSMIELIDMKDEQRQKKFKNFVIIFTYKDVNRKDPEEILIECKDVKEKLHIQKLIEDEINKIYLIKYNLVFSYFDNLLYQNKLNNNNSVI